LVERYQETQEKEERRFGRICAILVNAFSEKGAKSVSEEDFIPRPKEKKFPQSPDQQVDLLTMLALAAEASYGKKSSGGGKQDESVGETEAKQEGETVEETEPK